MDLLSALVDNGLYHVAAGILAKYLALSDIDSCRKVCSQWRRLVNDEVVRKLSESRRITWRCLFDDLRLKTVKLDKRKDGSVLKWVQYDGGSCLLVFSDEVLVYHNSICVGCVGISKCSGAAATDKFYVLKSEETNPELALPWVTKVTVVDRQSLRECHDIKHDIECGALLNTRTYLNKSKGVVFFTSIFKGAVSLLRLDPEKGCFKFYRSFNLNLRIHESGFQLSQLRLQHLDFPHVVFSEGFVKDLEMIHVHNFEDNQNVWFKDLSSRAVSHGRTFLDEELCGAFQATFLDDRRIYLFNLSTGEERVVSVPNLLPDGTLNGFLNVTCLRSKLLVFKLSKGSRQNKLVRTLNLDTLVIEEPFKDCEMFDEPMLSVRVCQNGLVRAYSAKSFSIMLADLIEGGKRVKVLKKSHTPNEPLDIWFGHGGCAEKCLVETVSDPVLYFGSKESFLCYLD